MVRIWPMPWPRAASSTITSSIQARSPVGIGNITRVSVPEIFPSERATSSVLASEPTTASSTARSAGGALLDSWGSRTPNASTTSSVTSRSTSTLTVTRALYRAARPVRGKPGRPGRSGRRVTRSPQAPDYAPRRPPPSSAHAEGVQPGRGAGRRHDDDQERRAEQERGRRGAQAGQPGRVDGQGLAAAQGLHRDQGGEQRHGDQGGEPLRPGMSQPLRRHGQPGQLKRVAAHRGDQDGDPGRAHRPGLSPAPPGAPSGPSGPGAAPAASTTGSPGGKNGVAARAMAAPASATARSVRPSRSRGHSSARNAAGPTTSRPKESEEPRWPAPSAPASVAAFQVR